MSEKQDNFYKALYEHQKIQLNEANQKINQLESKLNEYYLKIQELIQHNNKGTLCSIYGKCYEKLIYNILKFCYINNQPFNTQNENELGGSTSKNDIQCSFNEINNIGIEIKKYNTPDWMQCCIKYDFNTKTWFASNKGKIPIKSRRIFNDILNNLKLFNGDVPPFLNKQITHQEWLNIKKTTNKWNDFYINIPNNTIRKLYLEKDCQYIQISNNFGLYHLGNDICNFDVPLFEIDQQLRIRTKIHSRKNKKGFCNISVTASCLPININSIKKSPYSLDDKNKLPNNLIYKNLSDNNNF